MLRIKNYFRIFLTVLIFFSFMNCSSKYTWEWVQVDPLFDHTFIETIAVFEFYNISHRTGAGKIIADRIEQLMMEHSPYSIMNRMELDHILEEDNLSLLGLMDRNTARRLGELTGLDAILVGTVENYDLRQDAWEEQKGTRWDPNSETNVPAYVTVFQRTATIVITFKVLDTSSGQVVWSKTSHGEYSRKGSASHVSQMSEYEYYERALSEVLDDIWYLWPHNRRVRVPIAD